MTSRVLISICTLLLLAGCANFRSEQHFERDPTAVEAAKSALDAPGRATVYFFRQRAMMQPLIYIPIPPMYYAVDGTIELAPFV